VVHIKGGSFKMGPDSLSGDYQQVTVSSFYMGKDPVTQKEFEEVMGANPSTFKYENRPVERVNWFDAVEYCNRVSLKEGLTPAYTINGTNVTWNRKANGYRLPTEAEWEYAAKAAGTDKPFAADGTHPWGLCDMPGELWEWCWDWYAAYPGGNYTDPEGADSGTNRVMRAGVFGMCASKNEIVRLRSHGKPASKGFFVGFRLARS